MKIVLLFGFIFIISFLKINCNNCYEYSCEECDSPDYGNCTKCRDTFTLIDGTCPCHSSSCALCTTGLAGLYICEQCKEGYYNFNNNCYCLINNCEQCAENGCKKCISGYFFNETLKECIKQSDEEKIKCYDPNCDGCFSEEKGACDFCKEGYYVKKGECFNYTLAINRRCPEGYYRKDKYCLEECEGVYCKDKRRTWNWEIVYLCSENKCLVCEDNELFIFSECDNSDICPLSEGCLNCITSDECLLCKQGYYNLGGRCKKCSEGCSICSSEHNCQYCMSGYELTINNTCNLTYKFDYNQTVYEAKKMNLIVHYHPEEIEKIEYTTFVEKGEITQQIKQSENTIIPVISTEIEGISEIINETTINNNNNNNNSLLNDSNKINDFKYFFSCDKNCIKCFDNTGKCYECDKNYVLMEDKCYIADLECSDKNCLDCELKNGKEICNNCTSGYELKNSKCELICPFDNCFQCSLNKAQLTCSKCKNGYHLDDNKCKIDCIDNNCNICSEDGQTCTECQSETKLVNGKCALNYAKCVLSYPNCNYCFKDEGCIECKEGFELNNHVCVEKKSKTKFILLIIFFSIIIAVGVIIFVIYQKKKENPNNIFNMNIDQQSDAQSNNPYIYNLRNNIDIASSNRTIISKDEAAEEFETQRIKVKKAKMTCMFCKKKLGNYQCDCGCIVCKEHSLLKLIENNGVKYKGCYNCEKIVKKVTQIKHECNICFQKKNSLVHFKCGCALEVCKNCYIKIKISGSKCPGCRRVV